ncbi:MAG: hypothetical protein MZW92_30195 [Comamonadaceae bacterium]|nr:hypothetical protein [Comamonadaceae bacterium]
MIPPRPGGGAGAPATAGSGRIRGCPERIQLLSAVAAALAIVGLAGTAHADSFVSSASSAGSASSGSVSDSIEGSSDSSSGDDREVAEGPYRVEAVTVDAARPGTLRLTLRPADLARAAAGFVLRVPQAALGGAPLAAGDVVEARHRVYGVEFRRGATGQPFFLALLDDWQHDLRSRPVTL